jgi:hypothetical protein
MWITRDGEELAAEAMSDIHIKRAYSLLLRHGDVPVLAGSDPMPYGDDDQNWPEPPYGFMEVFEEEMKKRGIKF